MDVHLESPMMRPDVMDVPEVMDADPVFPLLSPQRRDFTSQGHHKHKPGRSYMIIAKEKWLLAVCETIKLPLEQMIDSNER